MHNRKKGKKKCDIHINDGKKEKKEKKEKKKKKINYEVPLLDSEAVPQPRCKKSRISFR